MINKFSIRKVFYFFVISLLVVLMFSCKEKNLISEHHCYPYQVFTYSINDIDIVKKSKTNSSRASKIIGWIDIKKLDDIYIKEVIHSLVKKCFTVDYNEIDYVSIEYQVLKNREGQDVIRVMKLHVFDKGNRLLEVSSNINYHR